MSAQRRAEAVAAHLAPNSVASKAEPAQSIRQVLFDELAYREKLFAILSSPRYDYQFDLSTKELRESTFLKCKDLLAHNVLAADDLVTHPAKAMTFLESVWVRVATFPFQLEFSCPR